MGRKKLVYLQLYIKDYTGDERLRWCSPSAWGVYSYLLCLLNTADVRGALSLSKLEQHPTWKNSLTNKCLAATTDRQRLACFASLLRRQMPWQKVQILDALAELAQFKVVIIQGDTLIQPRMYRESGHHLPAQADQLNTVLNENENEDEDETLRDENENQDENKTSVAADKPARTRFKPPTLDEVRAYFAEKGTTIDPEAFYAHYEANGWVQAKGKPIRNWKACLTTWEKRQSDFDRRTKRPKQNPTILSAKTPDEQEEW